MLFKASDAPWAKGQKQPAGDTVFVTDGPEFFRTKTGVLLMLWSSYDAKGYVQSQARSKSGTLAGPWEQLEPLVRVRQRPRHAVQALRRPVDDGGPPPVQERPRQALRDARRGDRLEIVRQRIDLDGDPVERVGGP